MHPRDAELDLLVEAVTGLPTTGTRVELEPARPIEQLPAGALAALAIVPVSDSSATISHAPSASQRREISALVVVYARTRAARSQACVEVERALAALRDPHRSVVLESVELSRRAEGDRLYMAGHRIRWKYIAMQGENAS